MKTEVIATLANYFRNEMGKKVLLVVPNTKPKDELKKRYKTRFGEDLPDGWEEDLGIVMTAGLLAKKILKDPQQRKLEEKKLLKYDVVMVDEVEYTINNSGFFLYDNLCKNAERFYGFSGSADRYNGNCISFAEGITPTVIQNKDLIKYFGPSLVHRMPVSNTVNNISVKTKSLNDVEFEENEIDEDDNVYNTIMNSIWTNPGVCDAICRIIDHYPKLYIPINNLETIINNWVDNYWKGKYRILVICHKGYLYYDKSGDMTNLTLEEAVEKMKNDEVDVIPSTASGFRALDFPNLSNMLMIAGKVAGQILQQIGRTARVQEMNIIHLEPKKFRWLPVYTKGMKHRDQMLKEYYKYCEINDITINEEDL